VQPCAPRNLTRDAVIDIQGKPAGSVSRRPGEINPYAAHRGVL
jgi:hypothetical protein